jgi:hypothetical protein
MSPNFEVFSAEPPGPPKIKKVQKVDSIVLWVQINFYPNPDGPAMISHS